MRGCRLLMLVVARETKALQKAKSVFDNDEREYEKYDGVQKTAISSPTPPPSMSSYHLAQEKTRAAPDFCLSCAFFRRVFALLCARFRLSRAAPTPRNRNDGDAASTIRQSKGRIDTAF